MDPSLTKLQRLKIQLAKTFNHVTFFMGCKSQGIIPRGLPSMINVPIRHFLEAGYIFVGIRRHPNSINSNN
jgi:hypothetical protein